MKRKGKKIKVFIIIILIILAVGETVLSKPETKFVAKDFFSRLKTNNIKQVELTEDLQTLQTSFEELKKSGNVTFNESMLLVNEEHTLKADWVPEKARCEEREVTMNSCIETPFFNLSQALRNETGETLYISSAYRTYDEQKRVKAQEGEVAQNAGASEHQTGLALDVYVKFYAGKGFIKSESGQFINEFCDDYGFIIRYPYFGEKDTGIGYEPWHIRYVGIPHSKIINGSLITLEEYINHFKIGQFYEYDGYIISRQNKDELCVPEKFESAVVSEDNTGNLFITFKI